MDAGPAPAKPAPVKPPEKPVSKPAEAPAKDPDKPEAAPDDKTPTAPVAAEEPPKPVKAAELRTAYEGLKKRFKEEYEPQLQSLSAKVKELEAREPEVTGPVVAKLKALEARNAELEKEMEFKDYESSADFKTKYDEPFTAQWADAVETFSQLQVTNPDTDETRPATADDLLQLSRMPVGNMDSAAKSMFGDSAARVIQHVEAVQKLWKAKQKAVGEAKVKAVEWKTNRKIEEEARIQNSVKTWNDMNKALEEKLPKAFQANQDDKDDVASHLKGFAMADLLFKGNGSLTPEQIESLPSDLRDAVRANKPLSDVQRIRLHAIARLKMANHDRKVVALNKATARIAELEKTIAEYEKSEPAAGKAGGGSKVSDKPWDEQVADELKELDRQ
jgi:hypothetical protein